MATFAELDKNNVVLRLGKACNIDVQNNGGDGSEQAAEYYKNNTRPLSEKGVRYVQTFFSGSARQRVAVVGGTYDPEKDVFIYPKPFPSWILNSENNWEAPIPAPVNRTYIDQDDGETYSLEVIFWDEALQTWKANETVEDQWGGEQGVPVWTWNKTSLIWEK